MGTRQNTKAIILAAGYATRLYPLTLNMPNPLLKVTKDKTVIDFIVDALEKSRLIKLLSVDDIARYMQDANAGAMTIQTMVFEPAKLRMHISLGKGPTSARPLKTLDLIQLFSSK